jgi:ADP-ribosylglycohydrolase
MSKIRDSFLGFVVGDAFGVPYDGYQRHNLKKEKIGEMVGYKTHSEPAGSWSDDTSMTLATMDSVINNNGYDYEDIMKNFCCWYSNGEYTASGKLFDIGKITRTAILNYRSNENIKKCGQGKITDNGNGSLSRMLPVAVYTYYKSVSDEDTYEIVKNVSSLTHSHKIAILGCFIYVKFMQYIFSGKSIREAYEATVKYRHYVEYAGIRATNYYAKILSGKIDKVKQEDLSTSGFILDSLEAVFWVALNSRNYEESIINSVMLGRDADTTCALVGSITGFVYGNIPDRWTDKLLKKDYILEMIEKYEEVSMQ